MTDQETWRAEVSEIQAILTGAHYKNVSFYNTPDGTMKLTVTRKGARVTLPGGEKHELEEWLALSEEHSS